MVHVVLVASEAVRRGSGACPSSRCYHEPLWLVLRARAPPRGLAVAHSVGLAVLDAKLLAVGGSDGSWLSSVETLSSAVGTWVTESNGLTMARERCVGACTHELSVNEQMLMGDK